MRATHDPKHLPALDGLRGVAILLVLAFHTTVLEPQSTLEKACCFVASCGFSGVDLFFVLSGFLITGILLDAEPSRRALMGFYARRALRTMPLYYAVLAFSWIVLPHVVPSAKAERFASVAADLPYYLFHLSNVAIAKAHAFRHPVLDVAWSLAIEEQFYLLWPLVVLACPRRTTFRIALFAGALALAARVGLVLGGFDAYATYVLTPCRIDALAAGALLAVMAREPGGLGAYRRHALRVLAVAAPLAVGAMYVDFRDEGSIALPGTRWPLATFGFSAIAFGFAALLVIAITAPPNGMLSRVLGSRILVAFGKYSYAIYLVHLPIRAVIRDRIFGPRWSDARVHFEAVLGSEIAGQMAFHALSAGAALGVAWVSYHLFEARFLALKNRFPLGPRRTRQDEGA